MTRRGFAWLLAALLVAGCGGGAGGADWPELGTEADPVDVDPRVLEPAVDPIRVPLDPASAFERPWDFFTEVDVPDVEGGTLREGMEVHRYPNLTVAGHYRGTGTYVFHDTDASAFYLWGDDFAGHFDGMVGPFAGDPREVLPAVAVPRTGG